MNNRSESDILKILIFYTLTRHREIIDENVKAPHNCDWTITIHVITNKYLERMLLLLNSYYGAMKKTLNLNRFLAKVWASRYIKFISPSYSRIYCSFRTVQQQKSTILI